MSALRTAAQQALEAAENRLPLIGQAAIIDELNALRAALEQQEPEQEPVAWSDARLRGIASDYFPDAKDWPAAMLCLRHLLMEQAKYPPASSRVPLAQQEQEPLSVEDLARALVASRVIDAAAIDDPDGYDDGVMLERVRGLHRRLAALAQQEQEPVAWSTRERFYEALDRAVGNVRQEMRIKTVTMRRKDHDIALPIIDAYSGHVLVGDPPRREWVSLTDEEIVEIVAECAASAHRWDDISVARAIEQALRSKNNG